MSPNHKKRFFIILGALFVLIFAIYFIKTKVNFKIDFAKGYPVLRSKKDKAVPDAPVELPMPVKVYKVSRVSFRDSLPSLGSVKGFRQYDLKFPTSGTIEYINFKPGERITQGDIIASLDQKEALLKLEYAKVEMDKQTKLFELGSTIEVKLKQSQLEYQSAKTELDKTNLIAMSDGYVGALEVDRGSYVTPQDKIGEFADMKDVFMEFGVIEKDIAKIREGQNVEIVLDSYGDQVFKGRVDSIAPIVEGRSRTVQVRSKIANPDERVKPGMFGRVSVLVYEKEDAIVIPSSSFKKKEDQYLVFIVHPDENKAVEAESAESAESTGPIMGTVEIRPIEIAYPTPDAIEVREGVEEGDLVIVDVEQDIQDKAKVEITETQEGIF